MSRFTGQNVIVTGGTRGIGKGIAEGFLAEGATVTSIYAGNQQGADNFLSANVAHSGRVFTKKLDVANYHAVEQFFNDYMGEQEKLDVVINCAGIRLDSILGMMKCEDWQRVIDVNLTGTFNVSKFAVMAMMRKRYGRIINITSPSGRIGIEGQANYAASKAGQVAIAKSLAKEVASRKITVNCISPGFIETDLISDMPVQAVEAYKKQVPLKRFGQVNEVVPSVLFLASNEAAYITGTVLEVSGGL